MNDTYALNGAKEGEVERVVGQLCSGPRIRGREGSNTKSCNLVPITYNVWDNEGSRQ